jgi:hypothetical protein
MHWIDHGYISLWEIYAPAAKESPNALFAFEHGEFATGAIKEIVETGALTCLPKGQRPTMVNSIGVVRKHTQINSASWSTLGEKNIKEGLRDLLVVDEVRLACFL